MLIILDESLKQKMIGNFFLKNVKFWSWSIWYGGVMLNDSLINFFIALQIP